MQVVEFVINQSISILWVHPHCLKSFKIFAFEINIYLGVKGESKDAECNKCKQREQTLYIYKNMIIYKTLYIKI